MILDRQTRFSSAQSVTAAAASTDLIDLKADRDMGVGQELYVVSVVTTALVGAGSVVVTAETDTAASFASPTTVQTLYTIPALAAVGDAFVARLQPFTTPEQFLRLQYAPGVVTAGAVTSFITSDVQKSRNYAKGFTITNPV